MTRALVVYESMWGNSELVAHAVAEGVAEVMPVDVLDVVAAPSTSTTSPSCWWAARRTAMPRAAEDPATPARSGARACGARAEERTAAPTAYDPPLEASSTGSAPCGPGSGRPSGAHRSRRGARRRQVDAHGIAWRRCTTAAPPPCSSPWTASTWPTSPSAALGRAERKGAIDTFDGAGYTALLTRLRGAGSGHGVGTDVRPVDRGVGRQRHRRARRHRGRHHRGQLPARRRRAVVGGALAARRGVGASRSTPTCAWSAWSPATSSSASRPSRPSPGSRRSTCRTRTSCGPPSAAPTWSSAAREPTVGEQPAAPGLGRQARRGRAAAGPATTFTSTPRCGLLRAVDVAAPPTDGLRVAGQPPGGALQLRPARQPGPPQPTAGCSPSSHPSPPGNRCMSLFTVAARRCPTRS